MDGDGLAVMIIGDAFSVHVQARARAMARCGYRVTLVSDHEAESEGLAVVAPHGRWPLARLVSHYRLIRSVAADLVHIHYAASMGAWLFLASGRRLPLVVTAMGGDVLDDEQHPLPRLAGWLTRQVLRRADRVTVKSTYLEARVAQAGVAPDRIVRVVWGVDTDLFRPVDGAAFRTRLGIADGEKVILSPRMLRPFYNIHLLIEAMPAIQSRIGTVRLLITGYGADPDYEARLRRRVFELGLDSAVIWVGALDQSDMPMAYGAADVTVSLPPSDGFPQSVLESLACGVPCVATQLDRFTEFLTEGETVIFTELTPQAVAAAVSRVLSDPVLASRLSGNGIGLVRERAAMRDDVARVDGLYREMAGAEITNRAPRFRAGLVLLGLALRQSLVKAVRSCAG
ncbi:MAG: glycosyltransferase family 4 protein [Alphaproteobacteria bacterium]|nr:glycosyltransferase family 4 protein [Alphaproteobacteria bacterium]